ncbi:hypothetical protein FGG08_000877 [Glutinoglossum americanum]|uniref:tRNA (guanine(10)-N(2))-methyltransferase n=1 Tax=Glutinoglossum americanum TaxID=1670608 RepID=A0A9P8I2X7_9PEZI|nr:hypothetical protein FGG08_000877 [Glutinoglossum americanum]
MTEYLIRLVQVHESFRKPEILALAALANINVEVLSYSESSPFCTVKLHDEATARALISRSVLSKAIFELWAAGSTYPDLHAAVRQNASARGTRYKTCSFKFEVDAYQGKRSAAAQRELIESFSYLGFNGPIVMRGAEETFCVFEEWDGSGTALKRVWMGRLIARGSRDAIATYDLKRRCYISTTSMDAELALITANLTLAAPGKLIYDPFAGTGSFLVAAAHFGAYVAGSDIDGRSVRGKDGKRDVKANFKQYGLEGRLLDVWVADLTNDPLRAGRWLDGILCDPPYGVREGLKVLGTRDREKVKEVIILGNGEAAHFFLALLSDILTFASTSLVDNGRLSLWMPTANESLTELSVPTHPSLELVSVCVQAFNKWSRRLLTYRRLPDKEVVYTEEFLRERMEMLGREGFVGATADELNDFRRKYFKGFKPPPHDSEAGS